MKRLIWLDSPSLGDYIPLQSLDFLLCNNHQFSDLGGGLGGVFGPNKYIYIYINKVEVW